jgi:hypothetical protein
MTRILSGGGKITGGKTGQSSNFRQSIQRFTGNRVGSSGTVSGVRRLFARDPADGLQDANVTLMLKAETTHASLTTALVGANNDLVFTAVNEGPPGNLIRIRYVDPGANDAVLSGTATLEYNASDEVVTVITFNLATDAGGLITSTATQIKAYSDANFDDLVSTALAAGNTGAGVVTEMDAGTEFLTGGVLAGLVNTVGVPSPRIVRAATTALRGTGKVAQSATPSGVKRVVNRSANRRIRKR